MPSNRTRRATACAESASRGSGFPPGFRQTRPVPGGAPRNRSSSRRGRWEPDRFARPRDRSLVPRACYTSLRISLSILFPFGVDSGMVGALRAGFSMWEAVLGRFAYNRGSGIPSSPRLPSSPPQTPFRRIHRMKNTSALFLVLVVAGAGSIPARAQSGRKLCRVDPHGLGQRQGQTPL